MQVLILGDSIRLDYLEAVREYIKNVDCPDDNCRFAAYLLYYLPYYKHAFGNKNYDVIHFNAGLWDVIRLEWEGYRTFTKLEDYTENIKRIAIKLHYEWPDSKIVFANITSVRDTCIVKDDVGGGFWALGTIVI